MSGFQRQLLIFNISNSRFTIFMTITKPFLVRTELDIYQNRYLYQLLKDIENKN